MRTSAVPPPNKWKVTGQAMAALLLCVVPSRADSFTKVKFTVNGHESVYKTYQQGGNFRTESQGPDGRVDIVVRNAGKNQTFHLDPQAKTFADMTPPPEDLLLTLARWIARPPRPITNRQSGKTVNIYHEIIDTGERKEFFGHTARHLIVRERTEAESGACIVSNQSERDGWYLSRINTAPNTGGRVRTSYRITSLAPTLMIVNGGCRDNIVEHGVQIDPGIAVLETTGPMTEEMLEFSNAPLDQRLFEIPEGYVRTTPARNLESEWRQLEGAFQSWLN